MRMPPRAAVSSSPSTSRRATRSRPDTWWRRSSDAGARPRWRSISEDSMSTNPSVLIERRGPALWITLNRPEKRNAIDASVIAGIRRGYAEAQADPAVRVIVLTGAGERAFCAGADLQPGGAFAFDPARPGTDYADLLRTAQAATLPSIARVNGVCMAGGVGLLCMTDLAVAADTCVFGLPEVKVGVFPMQVLSLLQRTVPRRTVAE